jgi:hypothetical protein
MATIERACKKASFAQLCYQVSTTSVSIDNVPRAGKDLPLNTCNALGQSSCNAKLCNQVGDMNTVPHVMSIIGSLCRATELCYQVGTTIDLPLPASTHLGAAQSDHGALCHTCEGKGVRSQIYMWYTWLYHSLYFCSACIACTSPTESCWYCLGCTGADIRTSQSRGADSRRAEQHHHQQGLWMPKCMHQQHVVLQRTAPYTQAVLQAAARGAPVLN